MSKKLKLTKMILETKEGQKVEISLDEAKDIYEQLHQLFGEKTRYLPSPSITPIWTWPYRPYQPYFTTSGGTTITSTGKSGTSVTYCGAES